MKNIGKRALSLLCAAVLLLSMLVLPESRIPAEATDGLNLAAMQIVLPASAVEVERTAATELQTYIRKMTGTTLSIVNEGANSGAGIYIGKTNYAAQNGVTYPTDGDEKGEAWAIKAVNGNLVLCGADSRGALYAVYHLLEDVLGVHWWNVWEEYVPTGNATVPADYAASGVPAMEYREVFIGNENTTDYPFYVRNRTNGDQTHIPASYGGQEHYGYLNVHTFNRYFTSDDFAAHPEWFSQVDGARVSDGQLCLTNSSLETEFANRLLAEVAKDPDAIYSVSPADNTRFCQCSSCQSQINTYGTSGYVLLFVNKMADAVKNAGYTDATVEMLVYWAYVDAPQGGVTPASNVQLRFADNYTDLLHGLDHANNADSMTRLQAWMDIAGNDVYYWQYVVNYNNNGIFPSMFHYGDDFATLVEMGVNGWFAEQEQCINADFWDMKLWLITKLMEKPVTGDEYTALMDEFIYGYYGEAGQHIRDYLYYMNAKSEATTESQDYGAHIIGAEWLSVQDILAGNEYFEKAFAAAGNDETLLRRLRSARSGLDRVIVENFHRWQSEASSAGLTLPFTRQEVGERIYQTVQEQAAFRGDYDVDQKNYLTYRYDGFSDTQAALPSGITADAGHYLEYTARDFRLATSAFSIVEDSDSLTGMAVKGDTSLDSSMKLSSSVSKLSLYYYNTASGKSTAISNIYASSIKSDQGYQLYSFTWLVPSNINVNDYIYMFGNWGLQNVLMTNELRAFAGQKVTVYLNMKVVGKAYGSSSKPVYYIDRMIVMPPYSQATHNYVVSPSAYGTDCRTLCTICGDVNLSEHTWGEATVTKAHSATQDGEKTQTCSICNVTQTDVIYAHGECKFGSYEHTENKGVYTGICAYGCGATNTVDASGIHVKAFNASDIFTFAYGTTYEDKMVSDADSVVGTAVQYAAYPRRNEDINWLIMGPNRSVMMYTTASGEQIFSLSGEELKANQGYQLYKFSYENFTISDNPGVIYMFGDWGLQSASLANTLKTYKGKTFDMYLSMKITGDIYGENLSNDSSVNWPVYYIDRVLIVEPCTFDEYVSDDNATCSYNGTKSHSCSLCGLTEHIMEPNTKDPQKHSWDDGTVTVAPTVDAEGEKTYTCTLCGTTRTEVLEKLPVPDTTLYDELEAMWTAGHGYANYVAANFDAGYGTVVTDADAYTGKAIHSKVKDLTGAGKLKIYRYNANSTQQYFQIADLSVEELKLNQGYQYYKFSLEVPADVNGSGGFMYFFDDDWALLHHAMGTVIGSFSGKHIDLYLSMKITGEPTAATIYIDRLAVVDPCANYISDDGYYCTKCGKQLVTDAKIELDAKEKIGHIYANYIATNFDAQYGTMVSDSEAYTSQAIHTTAKDLTGTGKFILYRYSGNANSDLQYFKLGELAAEDILINQGYQVYKFSVEVPAEGMGSGGYMYFFDDSWELLHHAMGTVIGNFAGKKVDLFLSMKVEGEPNSAVIYVDRLAVVSYCEDNWDSGKITTAPTITAEGVKTYTCTVCGKTRTENVDKLTTPAESWNLILDGNIGMQFILNLTEEEVPNATVQTVLNGVTNTVSAASLPENEAGRRVLTVELAAAQMTDSVTVTVQTGGNEVSKAYSVRAYADTILNGDYTDEAKVLVKQMLNYGAASQTYFSYNTDELANSGIAVTPAAVPTDGGEVSVSGKVSGVKFYGASLVHQNKIAVRLYFTAESLENISFGDYEYAEKNGMYYVEIADICPQDLEQDITVTVSNGTDTLTVSYAPLDYIIRMYVKGDASADLVQALYGYYLAAEAYIAQ